jgi:hypothetical protein
MGPDAAEGVGQGASLPLIGPWQGALDQDGPNIILRPAADTRTNGL